MPPAPGLIETMALAASCLPLIIACSSNASYWCSARSNSGASSASNESSSSANSAIALRSSAARFSSS